jgi:hypothetical protein
MVAEVAQIAVSIRFSNARLRVRATADFARRGTAEGVAGANDHFEK